MIFKHLNYWKVRLLIFLSVVGPGIITGTADNDAGGVTTYSIAGAHFGYQMLWILILITLMLYVTQEMGMRLGVVTGKGLGDLIREKLGLRFALILIGLVFIANFSNILADVAGIAAVADIYGIPRLIFVPIFMLLLWYVILKGSFNFVQNIFLTSCVLFFCYIVNGFLARPDIPAMLRGSLVPSLPMNRDFLFTATALIGTTLTVWGQFFVQSYFVDKGVQKKHIRSARLDVFFGAFWTDFVAYFIIISAAATLYVKGIRINSAVDAAMVLGPLLGAFAKHLFAWGLLNASLLGVCVITMGTAYAITEVLGTERKVDAAFKDAPLFYSIIGFCFFICTLLVLMPGLPIIFILTASQALNTIILPVIFIVILKLINDKKLMGINANGLVFNFISWITIASFTAISFLMLYFTFLK
ncbi:MAG: natural resistance-associated macrophage protein [Candidatus Saganbacteria bacterium]|uniref:Natural resistance-associated macrophage protein n=1 Tax=Candidatus Saganbacteria bacterium TaxID=2575572 RepID=A0A833NY68_UNCSA|nr:MAG: natural resistance-associated macrophage protein [Candidatus Saganbacteria bacterium]